MCNDKLAGKTFRLNLDGGVIFLLKSEFQLILVTIVIILNDLIVTGLSENGPFDNWPNDKWINRN